MVWSRHVHHESNHPEGATIMKLQPHPATCTPVAIMAPERRREGLALEHGDLAREIGTDAAFEEIVGRSTTLRELLESVRDVAATDSTILLSGETGTGKGLLARAIHDLSSRRQRAMVTVNCGALPAGLVESELFGHERGAFTGALQRRIGRFEQADHGTLFLDEIGELPLDGQVKLLGAVEEQEVERVGGSQPIRVDVRLVAATNRDLQTAVAAGRFRSDLFYRLNVVPLLLPPLRERTGDIPLLVQSFIEQFRRKLGKPLQGVSPESLRRLEAHSWPGNIRELQHVVERACVLARGRVVDLSASLLATAAATATTPGAAAGAFVTLEEHERAYVRRVLEATRGRIEGRRGAAAILDVHPSTLRSRLQRLGLARPKWPDLAPAPSAESGTPS
jgi:formate hydrogenlyase transcriptional activator